ncbi:MAG: hypothetical protein H6621_00920 [Halobacteriovoraceae bacterium]|nr:hypothetical protein [Halobacteriovoraceae bacterium]MCB9093603.1 hypothetical protein [Halobacteriovoraceae bacterium]
MGKLNHILTIDIGSNAMRVNVVTIDGEIVMDSPYSKRYPTRLGEDSFTKGIISRKKEKMLFEIFEEIKILQKHFKVTDTLAIATSALREAKNNQEIIKKIKDRFGIKIEIISGKHEAMLAFEAVREWMDISKGNYLIVDMGGGSTEIILGSNNEMKAFESFPIGTVRLIDVHPLSSMEKKISKSVDEVIEYFKSYPEFRKLDGIIGLGGNFRRVGKLRKILFSKESTTYANLNEVKDIYNQISMLTYEERVNQLKMRKDRADVIVPASYLILTLMQQARVKQLHLPRIGIRDGLVLLYLNEKKNLKSIKKLINYRENVSTTL